MPNFRKQQEPPIIKPQTRIHSRIILLRLPLPPPSCGAAIECAAARRKRALGATRRLILNLAAACCGWNVPSDMRKQRSYKVMRWC